MLALVPRASNTKTRRTSYSLSGSRLKPYSNPTNPTRDRLERLATRRRQVSALSGLTSMRAVAREPIFRLFGVYDLQRATAVMQKGQLPCRNQSWAFIVSHMGRTAAVQFQLTRTGQARKAPGRLWLGDGAGPPRLRRMHPRHQVRTSI